MTHTLKIIREGNYLFTEDMAYHLPLNNARKIPNLSLLPPLLKDDSETIPSFVMFTFSLRTEELTEPVYLYE